MSSAELSFSISFNREELQQQQQHCRTKESTPQNGDGAHCSSVTECVVCVSAYFHFTTTWQFRCRLQDNTPFEKDH